MDELFARVWADLVARIGGPMSFRLVLQPAVAVFLAVHAGIQDARRGSPFYTWSVFTDPEHRRDLLRQGWKEIAKVFVIAGVLDMVYQFVAFRWIYPGEALLVAFLLACVPYLLLRGVVNRLIRSRRPAGGRLT
jgi:hypothetical protein